MASSSQMLPFLFAASIALLLIAPHFGSALECYNRAPKFKNGPIRGRDMGELTNKLAKLGIGMPTTNGDETIECPEEWHSNLCVTLHCGKLTRGQTIKGCATLSDPEETCQELRNKDCPDDAKFYCRYCQGDLCNDEPIVD